MNILLTAINAKYIHSNLAVYSLQAYAKSQGENVQLAEYTINHRIEFILEDIYRRQPDVLCFSCYIWNIEYVRELAEELHRLLPRMSIWAGGPEASYETDTFLQENPAFTGIMSGEGEQTFTELCKYYAASGYDRIRDKGSLGLEEICGLVFVREGEIIHTPLREPVNMDDIPFCYERLSDFQNRIIYYESSRGCPYSCSYCLSSVDKRLRFRSLRLVLPELQFFIDQKVPQVKFVDRTFNCSHDHAMGIWRYLAEHDNGVTNFHFEVSADLLRPEEIDLIRSMRPGLIQLEIGVQSVNPVTIREIKRTMNLEKLKEKVEQIQEAHNVHQHLDLIAGLPFEDFESFRHSFDEIYRLKPEQLQLGFLKVLKGSYMYAHADEYGILYRKKPPYEVRATKWLSFDDVLNIRLVEEMLELHYNSGQFRRALRILEGVFESPFELYWRLGKFYLERGLRSQNFSRMKRCEIFLEFAAEEDPQHRRWYEQALTFDLYARENMKSRPAWAEELADWKRQQMQYLRASGREKKYCHLEPFDRAFLQQCGIAETKKCEAQPGDGNHGADTQYAASSGKVWILFDYEQRDPLTNEAKYSFAVLPQEQTE